MKTSLFSFPALFLATLLMLIGVGFFNTYVALYMNKLNASTLMIGTSIACYYFGMVLGAKVGQLFIAYFGHIRTFVACAGICTITILMHVLVKNVTFWMGFRFILGMAMMAQYMVIESWLNEQSDKKNRGTVFAGYMIAVNMGLILGQYFLRFLPELSITQLVLVAILFSSCLLPIALTRKIHPEAILAAPLEIRYFLKHTSPALLAVALGGALVGAFFGLAPIYAQKTGFDLANTSQFVAIAIIAGFLAQWPIGRLSDKFNRINLLKINILILGILCIPLWFGQFLGEYLLLGFSFLIGIFLFTIYPIAVSLANDCIPASKRVALSGLLLAVFGVGAGIGPIFAGFLMSHFSQNSLFIYFSISCVLVFILLYLLKNTIDINEEDKTPAVAEAPMSTAMLDPRIEPEDIPLEQFVQLDSIESRDNTTDNNMNNSSSH